jgi:hypothetical protein
LRAESERDFYDHPRGEMARDTDCGATTTTRAKDSDRQDACKILDNARNVGELSTEEHRERISTATNAVTPGDLQALVAELQNDSAALVTASPPA